MRILVLHNTIKSGSYADVLYRMLVLFLETHSFAVAEYDTIKEIRDAGSNKEKAVAILHTGKKQLSVFSRLALRSIIAKRNFDFLVQITDSIYISSQLPQLIVQNNFRDTATGNVSSSVSFAVCSEAEKQKIIEQNDAVSNHVEIIPVAAGEEYQSIAWSEQQVVKLQYTQGREYFLTFAEGKTIQSFTELLKAFSTFKKWQHSNMKLVVTGNLFFTNTDEWKEKLNTYKFREDVVLLNDVKSREAIRILGSAYAFIHTPGMDNDVLPLLQSINCETPCITFTTGSIEEYSGKATILIETNNYDQLAEKMILLYKDEALRSHLIIKGKETSHHYTNDRTFAALSQALSLPVH